MNLLQNTEIAFKSKSNWSLKKAYWLFKAIERPFMVQFGKVFLSISKSLHLPIWGLIKKSIFAQFCGGEKMEEAIALSHQMMDSRVYSILDYSVEGLYTEEAYNEAMNEILSTFPVAKENESIPFIVFKPTAFGNISIYEKVGRKSSLNADEQKQWDAIRDRFDRVTEHILKYKIKVMVDAEESWMQDAADDLVLDMMRRCNKEEALVFNTLQFYRWDRLDYLKEIHEIVKKENFKLGIKLVRGAYMEKENKRALDLEYESPINPTKAATDILYNNGLSYIVKHIEDFEVFVGSHNEASLLILSEMMKEYNIPSDDYRIWSGQLLGMSDHISYNLAYANYNVAKYMPYGPVKEVLPYLMRRAEENTSVSGQTGRELELIERELRRRKIHKD